jgi:hypothetical protein
MRQRVSNNRTMNAVIDIAPTAEGEVAGIADALAKWYAACPSVRRLWAIDDPIALNVFLALEPTSDGDDAFPVWLANSRVWANDLELLAGRRVQLRLLVSSSLEESYLNPDAVTIAEVSWRETWMTA